MSNHLTPTELASATGLDRQDVITTCMELGVPIFEGKIDKSLFAAARRSTEQASLTSSAPVPGGGPGLTAT
jgi:hypothetical protein